MIVGSKYFLSTACQENPAPFDRPENSQNIAFRIIFIFAIFAIELIAFRLFVHLPETEYNFSVPAGKFYALIYFCLGFLLFSSGHIKIIWRSLISFAERRPWRRILAAQVMFYLLAFYCSSKLYPNGMTPFDTSLSLDRKFLFSLYFMAAFITSVSAFALVGSVTYWKNLFRTEWMTFLLAAGFSVGHMIFYSLATQADDILSRPTIALAKFFLEFFYSDVRTDLAHAVLGRPDFSVIVDQMCAGYVGIGLIAVFLTWYLVMFRREVRFPAVFLLIPLGMGLIWISNCLRIALLIAIGSSLSSEVAVKGFHANAGWIFFITISLLCVAFARTCPVFSKISDRRSYLIAPVDVLPIPFLVMLGTTLLTSSLTAEFQWLYPIRVLAVGIAIYVVRKHVKLEKSNELLLPFMAGALVFIIWIMLVPPVGEADRKFSESLFSVGFLWSTSWLFIRLLGSIIIIPIAEELAFRGYLPKLFTRAADGRLPPWQTHALPFLVSSILFGALHRSIVAGTMAGAVYYLVRLGPGRLRGAILAHMTTNLLLCVYVLHSGYWSYW